MHQYLISLLLMLALTIASLLVGLGIYLIAQIPPSKQTKKQERWTTIIHGVSAQPTPYRDIGGNYLEIKLSNKGEVRVCSDDLFCGHHPEIAGIGIINKTGWNRLTQNTPKKIQEHVLATARAHFTTLNPSE